MALALIKILIGFVLLIYGAEYTVRGAVAIANKLNIPAIIIGLTIVAFGTSAPEFVVSISSAMKGSAGIALGNVIGSNIANVMLILGAAAMIYPIRANIKTFSRDYLFMMFVTILFAFFAKDGTFDNREGLFLLLLLAIFIFINYRNSKNSEDEESSVSPIANRSWAFVSLVTVGGLAGIIYGADLLVDGAVFVAKAFGVSEDIIGLTLIAFGTSLPELATTCMAAFRRQADVALGNIIGSNVWNIVLIMGASSSMVEIDVPTQFINFDIWVMILSSGFLLPIMYVSHKIGRLSGATYVLGYFMYIAVQWMAVKGQIIF